MAMVYDLSTWLQNVDIDNEQDLKCATWLVLEMRSLTDRLQRGDSGITREFDADMVLAFCANNSINLYDLIGLSEKDLEKDLDLMREIFEKEMERMNREGDRLPRSGKSWGLLNNLLFYKGCKDQALIMAKKFAEAKGELKFEEHWEFEVGYESLTHQRGWAIPSNPNDPVMNFDPWHRYFRPSNTRGPRRWIDYLLDYLPHRNAPTKPPGECPCG